MINLLGLGKSNRRRFRRHDCDARAVIVMANGAIVPGVLRDVSHGGFHFRPEGPAAFFGDSAMTLAVAQVYLPCVLVRRSREFCAYHFPQPITDQYLHQIIGGTKKTRRPARQSAMGLRLFHKT